MSTHVIELLQSTILNNANSNENKYLQNGKINGGNFFLTPQVPSLYFSTASKISTIFCFFSGFFLDIL